MVLKKEEEKERLLTKEWLREKVEDDAKKEQEQERKEAIKKENELKLKTMWRAQQLVLFVVAIFAVMVIAGLFAPILGISVATVIVGVGIIASVVGIATFIARHITAKMRSKKRILADSSTKIERPALKFAAAAKSAEQLEKKRALALEEMHAVTLKKMRADIKQCLTDWSGRSSDIVVIKSADGKEHKEETIEPSHLELNTQDDLMGFWKKNLLEPFKLDQDAQNIVLEYFSLFMHQGGLLHPLQTILSGIATFEGYFLRAEKRKVSFFVDAEGGKINIREGFNITDFIKLGERGKVSEEDEAKLLAPSETKMTAVAEYAIEIKDGMPNLVFNKIELIHNKESPSIQLFSDDKIKAIFLRDFIENVNSLYREFLLEKKASPKQGTLSN